MTLEARGKKTPSSSALAAAVVPFVCRYLDADGAVLFRALLAPARRPAVD